jgi:hypothetical protein
MVKWSLEDFDLAKAEGDFAASVTYEQFLNMKESQAELARQQKIEMFGEDLDEVPYEEPPELTPEDEAALIQAWAEVAKQKAAAEKDASSARAA